MIQPHGPSSASNLTTMRRPLHPAALATILERRPRQPIPTPGRRSPLPRYGFVIAIVAAHEAEHRLPATLESLDAQTRRPDAIVVVADSCTDATVVTALVHGATVVETRDNHHGCSGALDLALAEVLEMLDADDVVLIVGDGVTLAPRFIATGLAELWATPAPARRGRRTPRTAAAVTATPAAPAPTPSTLPTTPESAAPTAGLRSAEALRSLRPAIGTSWPGGSAASGTGATMVLAGALQGVAMAREDGTLAATPSGSGVLDPRAVDTEADLAVALTSLGHRRTAPDPCLAARHDGRAPTPGTMFAARHRSTQAALGAITNHGLGRHTRRPAATQVRVALEITAPLVAGATLLTGLALGRASLELAIALALVTALWLTERSWAARHAGRGLPAELVRGLARSIAAGAGAVTGFWHWLAGLRLRRRVWRHPVSGRVLARRPAPFPTPPPVALVRVPGAAIAIERSGPAPDVVAERWRRRALAVCAGALALVAVVGLPLALPVPTTIAVVGWAALITAVSASRLLRAIVAGRTPTPAAADRTAVGARAGRSATPGG